MSCWRVLPTVAEIGPFRRVNRSTLASCAASRSRAVRSRLRAASCQSAVPLSRPLPGKRACRSLKRPPSSFQIKRPLIRSSGRRWRSSGPALALRSSKLPAMASAWRSSGRTSACSVRRAAGAPSIQAAGSTSASSSLASAKGWRAKGVNRAWPLPLTPCSAATFTSIRSSGPSALTASRTAWSSSWPAMLASTRRGSGALPPSSAEPAITARPNRAPKSLRRCVFPSLAKTPRRSPALNTWP